jgi:hypothetical protein
VAYKLKFTVINDGLILKTYRLPFDDRGTEDVIAAFLSIITRCLSKVSLPAPQSETWAMKLRSSFLQSLMFLHFLKSVQIPVRKDIGLYTKGLASARS